MRTLHAYLIRQVIASLLMTVAVFTFVLLVGNLLREILLLLVNRQATMGVVIQAVGLLVPFVWAFALPMAMLTATLLVFGRFSADQELTAVRASGISLLSLITPILFLSVFLCGVCAMVNLEIAPQCRVAYKSLIASLKAQLSRTPLPEGRFIRDFPGYIITVGKNRDGDLRDVKVFELGNKTNITAAVYAPRGHYELDKVNNQIVVQLFDAVRTELSGPPEISKGDVTKKLDLPSSEKVADKPPISDMTYAQLEDEKQDLDRRMAAPIPLQRIPPDQRQAWRRELEKQRQDLTLPIRVQIHRQVAFSFACFGFTLVGIPLGIRVHRRETNVSFMIALLLVIVYYSFILVGQALDNRPEWVPHLIVWIPNFIFQAVGAVLLWRANRGD